MPCGQRSKMRKPATRTKEAARREKHLILDGIDLEHLRSALFAVPERATFIAEEGVSDEDLIPASVLFPIVLRAEGPSVLLTQRTDHLRDHPGQVSFPGGRVEPDDSSPAHTALREAKEEI